MPECCDIFLSHSGAQKVFVKQLYEELTRRYDGQHRVFYDEYSIKHGESISSTIMKNAKTCDLAVAVLSEEYFTRSKPPMLELAASFKASKHGNGVPCLLPVFLGLRPEHAKEYSRQLVWKSKWEEWELNEKMNINTSSRSKTKRVEPLIWKEALDQLLDTRGPVYKPHVHGNTSVFAEFVAEVIGEKLDELCGSYKLQDCMQQNKGTEGSWEGASTSEYSKEGSMDEATEEAIWNILSTDASTRTRSPSPMDISTQSRSLMAISTRSWSPAHGSTHKLSMDGSTEGSPDGSTEGFLESWSMEGSQGSPERSPEWSRESWSTEGSPERSTEGSPDRPSRTRSYQLYQRPLVRPYRRSMERPYRTRLSDF
ncbi:hypothetical protein M758_8G040700 [Ceratodon purpureus]|nr:hypothetical protein M758_8G040700 [Ceratodon purpureus]